MDYESEAAIRTVFRNQQGQVTILIIAHRLAAVRTAERALVLEKGPLQKMELYRNLLPIPMDI